MQNHFEPKILPFPAMLVFKVFFGVTDVIKYRLHILTPFNCLGHAPKTRVLYSKKQERQKYNFGMAAMP